MRDYDDEDVNEGYSINDIEKKLDNLQILFCHTVFEEVQNGNPVECDDLQEALSYFSNLEEYEKCIKIKKAIDKNKCNERT